MAAVAATDALFVRLIDTADKDGWIHFLLTFRKLVTSQHLLQVWFSTLQHKVKGNRNDPAIRLLIEFLDYWIQNSFAMGVKDFSKKNLGILIGMIDQLTNATLKNELKLKVLKISKSTIDPTSAGIRLPGSPDRGTLRQLKLERPAAAPVIPPTLAEGQDFITFSSGDIATALTQIDYRLFSRVTAREILQKTGWLPAPASARSNNNSNSNTTTPNTANNASDTNNNSGPKATGDLAKFIDRFNEVSHWVVTEILQRAGKTQRHTLQKFIDIAIRCEKMKSFNMMWAVVAGLNNSSVQRLKNLWAAIGDRHRQSFDELEKGILNPEKGFRNYQEVLKTCQLPTLPYFGLFLRDLTFNNENTLINPDTGALDFESMKLVAHVIKEIQRYQSVPFVMEAFVSPMAPTPSVNLVPYFEKLNVITDEEFLYKLSLQAEPSLFATTSADFSGVSNNSGDSWASYHDDATEYSAASSDTEKSTGSQTPKRGDRKNTSTA